MDTSVVIVAPDALALPHIFLVIKKKNKLKT